MSGQLSHPPAEIVRQLLVDQGLGSEPNTGGTWPVYAHREPDSPDGVITVRRTAGRTHFRTHVDGRQQTHYGVQIRVRGATGTGAGNKAEAVAAHLDQQVYQAVVTLQGVSYEVHSLNRSGDVLDLGQESPTSRRSVNTINYLTSIRQLE